MSRWIDAARRADGLTPADKTADTRENLAAGLPEPYRQNRQNPTQPRERGFRPVTSVLSEGAEAGIRPRLPDLDSFEERAAVAEHDGGLSREAAERAAAEALGFAHPAEVYAAAADGWRRNLEALARRERSDRGLDMIRAALTFVADGWAVKAAALGWTELELLGADPAAPWARFDRLGAAFSPWTVADVTAERIVYAEGAKGVPLTRWRGSRAGGAALAWGERRGDDGSGLGRAFPRRPAGAQGAGRRPRQALRRARLL